MKKYIYLFILFALCISITVAHAASPAYDDNPPSYIWGDGGLNPQTSGTPNKTGEDRIIDAISGLNINIGDISADTSNIESHLKKTEDGTTKTIADMISDIAKSVVKVSAYDTYYNLMDFLINMSVDTNAIKNHTTILTQRHLPLDTEGLASNTVIIKNEIASISSNIGELIANSGGSGGSSDNSPSLFYTQRHKFVAPYTVTQIFPLLPNYSQNSTEKRVFVELRTIDPDDEFYIGFDSNTYDTEGRPVKGRILLNMPATQELYIYHINQSDISIQQTEGWN